jgi:hypothetical protein
MVVVAEEHVIERTEVRRAERRPCEFSQRRGSGWVFAAGRIERRVREQADRAEFQQRGGAADVGEREKRGFHSRGFIRASPGFPV